jgi:hypothetical protein
LKKGEGKPPTRVSTPDAPPMKAEGKVPPRLRLSVRGCEEYAILVRVSLGYHPGMPDDTTRRHHLLTTALVGALLPGDVPEGP